MKKENILYGVIGLLAGIVIASCLHSYGYNRSDMKMRMHRMPDGSMMNNSSDMASMMGDMMAGLEGKSGDAFDKEFLSEMVVHHQGAVDMARAVLAKSKRPELIKLANDIISAQNKEIEMMQKWQTDWFK